MNKRIIKFLIMFFEGAATYAMVEVLFRGYSHRLMLLLGGISMCLLSAIQEITSWDTPFVLQCFIGGILITSMEYIVGVIDRVYLGIHIWDYSNLPLSDPLGVINFFFFLAWCLLSAVGIILSDTISYYCFHENPQPYYKSVTGKILFMLPKRECDVANHEES